MPEGPPDLSLSSLVGRVCSKPEQERSLDPTSVGALSVEGWGRETEVGKMGVGEGWERGGRAGCSALALSHVVTVNPDIVGRLQQGTC